VKAEVGHSQVPTVAGLLDAAATRISTALGLERREARFEAQILVSRAICVNRAWLIAHGQDTPDRAQSAAIEALVARREQGEPVAYILGEKEFYGHLFMVNPDVLIPRPDTELLIEQALARIPSDLAVDVLDLGTGSGCIAITLALARPLARVTAVDRSPAALAIAQRNADILNARVEFLTSDWFEALAGRRFDLVVSNPPYIAAADPHLARGDVRFEPLTALAAGQDGFDDLRRLIHGACAHLKPGGTLLLEHGYDQSEGVKALLRESGFSHPRSWADLSGILRISAGEVSE